MPYHHQTISYNNHYDYKAYKRPRSKSRSRSRVRSRSPLLSRRSNISGNYYTTRKRFNNESSSDAYKSNYMPYDRRLNEVNDNGLRITINNEKYNYMTNTSSIDYRHNSDANSSRMPLMSRDLGMAPIRNSSGQFGYTFGDRKYETNQPKPSMDHGYESSRYRPNKSLNDRYDGNCNYAADRYRESTQYKSPRRHPVPFSEYVNCFEHTQRVSSRSSDNLRSTRQQSHHHQHSFPDYSSQTNKTDYNHGPSRSYYTNNDNERHRHKPLADCQPNILAKPTKVKNEELDCWDTTPPAEKPSSKKEKSSDQIHGSDRGHRSACRKSSSTGSSALHSSSSKQVQDRNGHSSRSDSYHNNKTERHRDPIDRSNTLAKVKPTEEVLECWDTPESLPSPATRTEKPSDKGQESRIKVHVEATTPTGNMTSKPTKLLEFESDVDYRLIKSDHGVNKAPSCADALQTTETTPNHKKAFTCPESPASTSMSQSVSIPSNLVIDEHQPIMNDTDYVRLVQLKESVMEKKYMLKYYEVHLARLKQKRIKEQFNSGSADSTTKKSSVYQFTKHFQDNLIESKSSYEKTLINLIDELKSKNKLTNGVDKPVDFLCKECDFTFDKLNCYLDHLFSNGHLEKFCFTTNFKCLNDTDKQNMKFILDNDNENSLPKGTEFLFPCKAFYCSLCDELCANADLIELHLQSIGHSQKYQDLLKNEPVHSDISVFKL